MPVKRKRSGFSIQDQTRKIFCHEENAKKENVKYADIEARDAEKTPRNYNLNRRSLPFKEELQEPPSLVNGNHRSVFKATTLNNVDLALNGGHDTLVQRFSLPSNLYRFLAERHHTQPIILRRTLRYMSPVIRKATVRKRCLSEVVQFLSGSTKVDCNKSHVDTRQDNHPKDKEIQNIMIVAWSPDHLHNATLNINIKGFFDSLREKEWSTVEATLDVLVVHRWHDRRKDRFGQVIKSLVSSHELICNPDKGNSSEIANTISLLYKDLMESTGACRVTGSYLILRINAKEKRVYSKVYDSPPGSRRRSGRKQDIFPVAYRATLPLMVHSGLRLQLSPGDYEVRMEVDANPGDTTAPYGLEWKRVQFPAEAPALDEYARWPVIKFVVDWTGLQEGCQNGGDAEKESNSPRNYQPVTRCNATNLRTEEGSGKSCVSVTYRFMVDGRVRQWSEATDLVCPWCGTDCLRSGLGGLRFHLQCWHPRFEFTWKHKGPNRAEVTVQVGLGSADEQTSNFGLCHGRFQKRPLHRPGVFTDIIYFHGTKRLDMDKVYGQASPRPTEKRLYSHSWSSLPVGRDECENDSEEEDSLRWVHDHYARNIEEFTDVNNGEKHLMRLWNSHLLKYNFLGECQLGNAVDCFIADHGQSILDQRLRANLLLHLSNLADYGLLPPTGMEKAILKLDALDAAATDSPV